MSNKIVKVEVFKTTDNATFENEEDAEHWQSRLDLKEFFETCDNIYTVASGTLDVDELCQALADKNNAITLAKILYKVATNKEMLE